MGIHSHQPRPRRSAPGTKRRAKASAAVQQNWMRPCRVPASKIALPEAERGLPPAFRGLPIFAIASSADPPRKRILAPLHKEHFQHQRRGNAGQCPQGEPCDPSRPEAPRRDGQCGKRERPAFVLDPTGQSNGESGRRQRARLGALVRRFQKHQRAQEREPLEQVRILRRSLRGEYLRG